RGTWRGDGALPPLPPRAGAHRALPRDPAAAQAPRHRSLRDRQAAREAAPGALSARYLRNLTTLVVRAAVPTLSRERMTTVTFFFLIAALRAFAPTLMRTTLRLPPLTRKAALPSVVVPMPIPSRPSQRPAAGGQLMLTLTMRCLLARSEFDSTSTGLGWAGLAGVLGPIGPCGP